MITKLVLKNFKSIGERRYDFTNFDLLVGRNNSGKSTILQALAIWQFCVYEFHRAKRGGSTGKQVVLPNFTALPLPEFNLLWKDRTERRYPVYDKKKVQEYILIEIAVSWMTQERTERTFNVSLRYSSPQSVFAIPGGGWKEFREIEPDPFLPRIAYVPPFSGLEPFEEWRDDGPIRKQVGKAQPGSVLRNLLLRVCPPIETDGKTRRDREVASPDWVEIRDVVKRWFSVELQEPKYERGVDTQIQCEYQQGKERYDIIAGGSGFHQTLTLLAFLYGYKPTTILLDEPDAHLHVNLQREILDYFKNRSESRKTQFLIATHSEEFVKGVSPQQVVSLLNQDPTRVESKPEILTAMADVSNSELTQLLSSPKFPVMLYVEGESDERILRAWAKTCDAEDVFAKICTSVMSGGNKSLMKDEADRHFRGVRQIIPHAKRLMLFDLDSDETAFHPSPENEALYEWKRKNIENYLLVSDAWIRAASKLLGLVEDNLFFLQVKSEIEKFFAEENLTLPANQHWRNVSANVFGVVDGKKLLYENRDSLFQRLRTAKNGFGGVDLIRESVAGQMRADEIHNDVHEFFRRLIALVPAQTVASTAL
jgi:hypothetical protein